MNSALRDGETDTQAGIDRSDRVFQKDAFWYFHTRENVQIGPFNDQDLAIKGANNYVDFAVDADPTVLDSLSD